MKIIKIFMTDLLFFAFVHKDIVPSWFASVFASDQINAVKSFLNFIKKNFDPRFIVVGENCRFGKNAAGNIEFLKSMQNTFCRKR